MHPCTPPASLDQPRFGWLESPWVVLPMIFLVAGPLALPMLWRSRCFTRHWKLIVTTGCLVYTAMLLWYGGVLVEQMVTSLQRLDEFQKF